MTLRMKTENWVLDGAAHDFDDPISQKRIKRERHLDGQTSDEVIPMITSSSDESNQEMLSCTVIGAKLKLVYECEYRAPD